METKDEANLAVGPGTLTQTPEAQPSLLDGITEYEWVDLFNPLSTPFWAQVASSRPVNAPVRVHQTPGLQSGIQTESDLAMGYGLTGFKNPDHPSNTHISHTIKLESGRVRRLPGNEAQVVLRQLVGYLLQIEGKGLKLADPFERRQAEERIIKGKGNIADLMAEQPTSVRDQLQNAVEQSNEDNNRAQEVEFPDVTGTGADVVSSVGQPDGGDSPSPKA